MLPLAGRNSTEDGRKKSGVRFTSCCSHATSRKPTGIYKCSARIIRKSVKRFALTLEASAQCSRNMSYHDVVYPLVYSLFVIGLAQHLLLCSGPA